MDEWEDIPELRPIPGPAPAPIDPPGPDVIAPPIIIHQAP